MKMFVAIIGLLLAVFSQAGSATISSGCFAAAVCCQGQDLCMEESADVVEEAVIQPSRRMQRQLPQEPSRFSPEIPFAAFLPGAVRIPDCFCFERQWLTGCRLRL